MNTDSLPADFLLPAPAPKQGYWQRMGGGSLMVSLTLHGLFILIAIFLISIAVRGNNKEQEPPDFLAGGGGGGKSTDATKVSKRRAVSMAQPRARVTAAVSNSTVVLPDAPMVTNKASLTNLSMPSGGRGGGDGGLSGSGRGGMRGNGFGAGVGPGSGPGFVGMFGKKLNVRRLGVVLDVSRSMHTYLPTVVREANKIGAGAPIVMAYGCGAARPGKNESKGKSMAEVAKGQDFDHFWHRIPNGGAPDKDKPVDLGKPVPLKDSYEVLNGRKDTYFIEKSGKSNAWASIIVNELRGVDAVYWFADFQDPVDTATLKELAEEMKRRRQKLYVHASGENAQALADVITHVVKPTGGEEIKVDLKKK